MKLPKAIKIDFEVGKDAKEQVFDIIEEYMDLKNDHYTIRIIGRKDKQVKAFGILLDSTEGFGSTKKNVYGINGIQKRKLDKIKIKYEIKSRTLRRKE